MSHASGKITFVDGTVKYYEYDGTTDVCISHLYDTYKEMESNWRKGKWIYCKCGKDEEAVIENNYGGGHKEIGRACRYCNAITKDPFRD